jgi:prevent-host-death family protein
MPKTTAVPRRKKSARSEVLSVRTRWQLQTAKARFSEVFRQARSEGPQLITRQGKDGVVMLPVEQFERLIERAGQPGSLVEFFRQSPLAGLELDLDRDKDPGREIEF